jgi:hypothetical protein
MHKNCNCHRHHRTLSKTQHTSWSRPQLTVTERPARLSVDHVNIFQRLSPLYGWADCAVAAATSGTTLHSHGRAMVDPDSGNISKRSCDGLVFLYPLHIWCTHTIKIIISVVLKILEDMLFQIAIEKDPVRADRTSVPPKICSCEVKTIKRSRNTFTTIQPLF